MVYLFPWISWRTQDCEAARIRYGRVCDLEIGMRGEAAATVALDNLLAQDVYLHSRHHSQKLLGSSRHGRVFRSVSGFQGKWAMRKWVSWWQPQDALRYHMHLFLSACRGFCWSPLCLDQLHHRPEC